jgi:hypothetical protein
MKPYLTHALLVSVALFLAYGFTALTAETPVPRSDIPDLAVSSGEVRGATFPDIPTELPKVDTNEVKRGYEKVLATLRKWREQLMAVLRDQQFFKNVK